MALENGNTNSLEYFSEMCGTLKSAVTSCPGASPIQGAPPYWTLMPIPIDDLPEPTLYFQRLSWCSLPSGNDQHSYWTWFIYSEFSHYQCWFSILMFVSQPIGGQSHSKWWQRWSFDIWKTAQFPPFISEVGASMVFVIMIPWLFIYKILYIHIIHIYIYVYT